MSGNKPFIGVISDTHGLLRDDVLESLRGAELIIHAGDLVNPEHLTELEAIAPVVAVKGNMDRPGLPSSEVFDHRGRRFIVLHALDELDVDPISTEADYVIHGHTHIPDLEDIRGVTYLNPGSCGPERRGKPVSIAKIFVDDGWSIKLYEF